MYSNAFWDSYGTVMCRYIQNGPYTYMYEKNLCQLQKTILCGDKQKDKIDRKLDAKNHEIKGHTIDKGSYV